MASNKFRDFFLINSSNYFLILLGLKKFRVVQIYFKDKKYHNIFKFYI